MRFLQLTADVGQTGSPVSVFMPESYLATVPPANQQFFEKFFNTQAFRLWSDHELRRVDRTKSGRDLLDSGDRPEDGEAL